MDAQYWCERAINLAQKADESMPHMIPDHALLLFYSTNVGIREHQDNGRNAGRGDAPIAVSSNFEKSEENLVRMSKDETKTNMRLDSGDVRLSLVGLVGCSATVKIYKKRTSPYPDLLKDSELDPSRKRGRISKFQTGRTLLEEEARSGIMRNKREH